MIKLIKKYYSLILILLNIHLSLHIRQCCLDYGLLYTYWCYSFERINDLLGFYLISNWLIESELMRILITNAQVEFRINLADSDGARLLLDQVLLLLDKKVHESLKITKNFESKDLI